MYVVSTLCMCVCVYLCICVQRAGVWIVCVWGGGVCIVSLGEKVLALRIRYRDYIIWTTHQGTEFIVTTSVLRHIMSHSCVCPHTHYRHTQCVCACVCVCGQCVCVCVCVDSICVFVCGHSACVCGFSERMGKNILQEIDRNRQMVGGVFHVHGQVNGEILLNPLITTHRTIKRQPPYFFRSDEVSIRSKAPYSATSRSVLLPP